jgi:DNA polymerase-1
VNDEDPEEVYKQAVNMPIQGTAAETMRASMVALHRLGFPMITNVHDALTFEVKKEDAMDVIREASAVMVEVAEGILGVKVRVEATMGVNWGEMHEVPIA